MILPKNFQQNFFYNFEIITNLFIFTEFYSRWASVAMSLKKSNDQKIICNLQLILQMMDLHYAFYK